MGYENSMCKVKVLAMHRPTHETWREDIGNYPYAWHFSGRRRLWEIRVQMRFKQVPTSPVFFGLEMRFIPFTLSPWVNRVKHILIKAMSAAVGGEIYQTPGEDPDTTAGEAEPPTFAMPLWALDQFHVSDPGGEPDLTGDLEGIGLRRTAGLRQYIQALKAELNNPSTEKVYTFCFWGVSQFADAIHWEMRMSGFKMDAASLCGKPPVYVVLYTLPGVQRDDTDRRHLPSRKSYYWKVACWNASKPYDEDEVRAMETRDSARTGSTSVTERGSRTLRGAAFGEWFSCCVGRADCSGSPDLPAEFRLPAYAKG